MKLSRGRLALLQDRLEAEGITPGPEGPMRVSRGGELPLSFAQERLWVMDQMEPVSAAYHVPLRLRVAGGLDARALAWALGEVARRHEVLRTTFGVAADGRPVQVIGEPRPVPLPVVDLSALDAPAREAVVERLDGEDAARRFDLARGPLLRCMLLRLAPADGVILLTLHHVVTDLWSMDPLVKEVAALYEARVRGEAAVLPELPVQYADFAAWQRRWVEGPVLEGEIAYWRARLAGAPAVLLLPTARPRRAAAGGRGAGCGVLVPAGVAARLRELGRREGATLFMTLLAAWQGLLGRYGAGDDVVVGTPSSERTHLQTEGLIGFFVNTLVIRTRLAGDPTFREVLARVREGVLEAQAHQNLPFERLVDELRVERSPAHHPLFQVVFTLNHSHVGALEFGGARLQVLPARTRDVQFDLSLTMNDAGGALSGTLAYRAERFDQATIEHMAVYFVRLLGAVAHDPEVRLAEVELLDAEERRRVVEEWNATERVHPGAGCLHELFEWQAARTPKAPALVWEGGSLAYHELNARANRLARYLRRLDVGLEAVVAICLERSPGLVVAMLAVMKAGGAFLPMDPGYPPERLRYLLEDSGARVLLTDTILRERLDEAASSGVRVVCLDEKHDSIVRRPAWNPRGGTGPGNLAYVIYTSGSTGRPKGVAVEHGSVAVYASEMARLLELGEGERFLQFASPGFDVVVEEVFPALVSGAAVVIGGAELLEPAELARVAEATSVSVMELPTAYWHEWVRLLAEEGVRTPPSLRRVLMGGERVLPERLRAWRELGCELIHVFGLTETTVTNTIHRLAAGADAGEGELTIGRPIANNRVYVLDAALRPVPIGVPGELYVGGEGVARGYLRRPALTAQRFVPDPFSSAPGARAYRTGDRVRWRADGTLEFLGRADEQVKVRGYRIEPGEIEGVLAEHPSVGEVVVVAREDHSGQARLVAYVVGCNGQPHASELRAHLRERLPGYLMPREFVALERLPLNPSGKVDRGALPAPPEATASGAYEAPRTQAEEVLAGIWAEVLHLERVGVEDNFFELGGQSLLATRVVSRVRRSFRVELPLRALFEAQTVRSLAGRIRSLAAGGAAAAAPGIVPVPRSGDLPLSFAQERLWFLEQLHPGTPAYNIPAALRLTGALQVGPLRHSLAEVVRRHEVLRTTFAARDDGRAVQVVAREGGASLPVVDLTGLADPCRDREAAKLACEEALRPFDLARGPLLRTVLLRRSPGEHTLLVSLHHIVSDGWSVDVLVREVGALYEAFVHEAPSPLADLPLQYADYAVWQREWLAGEVLERELGYWRKRLAGVPPLLALPGDRPRPPVAAGRAGRLAFAFPDVAVQALRSLARREGATLFMALLAVFHALLARWTGQHDVSVGSPVANRTRLETEGLVGFFANLLVLRVDLSGDPVATELLARVREAVLGAQMHQDLPFERLVDELEVERTLGHAPLVQVVFSMYAPGAEEAILRLDSVEAAPEAVSADGVAKFDLVLGVAELQNGRVTGSLSYRTDLFDAATAERMSGHLVRLAGAFGSGPERRLSALEMLDEVERRQVLEAWNPTARGWPQELCLHQRFERRAAATPDAAAVSFEGRVLSYGELNARANRLARCLRARGVAAESRVGLCAERSLELVVGLLAILKAGAAYVPLDPAYPAERLAYMAGDSGIRVLLCQSALRNRVPAEGMEVIALEDARRSGLADDLDVAGPPDCLAYVIYTSGSTGRPKGVGVTHANVLRLFYATEDWFGCGAGDAWTLFHSCAFDFSVWEIWGALLYGGRVVIVPQEVSRDPAAFRELLASERVTVLSQTPSAFGALAQADEEASEPLHHLRLVVFGGEALQYESLRGWLDRYGLTRPRLVNMYGITETTVFVTHHPVSGRELREAGVGSGVGVPIPDLRVYVLDPAGYPAPVGVPGELHVGGAGLARGYLGRPGLTSERFVPDPFSGLAGGRLYRSGDLARWRPGGTLEYLGRIDQQVKVRGFRIEPGEIAAVLAEHPGVRGAVAAVQDGSGGRRLVAYVVGEDGAAPSGASLRAWAKERLPDYMVPTAYVALDALPLTANGKVDRAALPALGWAADEAGHVAPRTGTETALAAIWSEVLRVECPGVHDDFFALGGDSILSIQVVARARKAGLLLTPRLVFEQPTVAGQAALCDAAAVGALEPVAGDVPEPAGDERAGVDAGTLAFLEQRLALEDGGEPYE
jgi:amino acid adenylation domain-containing protein